MSALAPSHFSPVVWTRICTVIYHLLPGTQDVALDPQSPASYVIRSVTIDSHIHHSERKARALRGLEALVYSYDSFSETGSASALKVSSPSFTLQHHGLTSS